MNDLECQARWEAAGKQNPILVGTPEGDAVMAWVAKQNKPVQTRGFEICNREKIMGDGIRSMVDGKVYTSRPAYETHLRDNCCAVVGNDYKSMAEKAKEVGNKERLAKPQRKELDLHD